MIVSPGLEATISSGTKDNPLTERSANAIASSSSGTAAPYTERSTGTSALSSSDSSTTPEGVPSTDKVSTSYETSTKQEASTSKDATPHDVLASTEAATSGDSQGSLHLIIIISLGCYFSLTLTTGKNEKLHSIHVPAITIYMVEAIILLKKYDLSEYVKFVAISWKFDICQ